jgi:hypothetical protein
VVEDIATGLSSLNGLKFSVYPAFARQTRGLVHLKTAGTSYPEALRVAAALAPGLFREIYALARRRYETDRASYHVPADTGHAPGDFGDAGLPSLLERFAAREILHVTFVHVTFGSELNRASYRDRLFALLREHPEDYAAALEREAIRKA